MKKSNLFQALIIFLMTLMCVISFTACPDVNPKIPGGNDANKIAEGLRGKLLILQAYGTGTGGGAGISHTFVELYNNSDKGINLDGFNLWYANGTSLTAPDDPPADKDDSWNLINLSGTIPAGGSYLILGDNNNLASASHKITYTGDNDVKDFNMSNKSFKVALIYGSTILNEDIQNPFDTDGNGTKVAGYIDMVGARNDASEDQILGYETAPARNSASEAVRRKDLTDTDNNQGLNEEYAPDGTGDFISLRYNGMSDEEFEVRRPRTSSNGKWNPFKKPATPPGPTDNTLLILQVGAATDGNISHSFVELYNNGEEEVNLSGYSLQYAEGTRGSPTVTEDGGWKKIDLSGTIPIRHSFLILGSEGIGQTSTTNPALALTAGSGDMNVSFVISNRSFKVAFMSTTTLLTVQNPFDVGDGEKADSYVDMVGAMNTVGEDKINGYEYLPITDLNKQTGQRRTSLVDTDNNKGDFARAVFQNASAANLAKLRPKNTAYGEWDPFEDIIIPPGEGSPKLMIFQAGASTDGAITRNFVELYNNTDSPINLNTYSLHYGVIGASWNKIDLTGTIPTKGSYLVMSNIGITNNDNRLFIDDSAADQVVPTFTLSNDGFKVVLMSNQNILSVANPFNTGSGEQAAGYVDMFGGRNDTSAVPDASEGPIPVTNSTVPDILSKQKAARRGSLTDTDVNTADFVEIDYRTSGTTNDQVAKFRPRYSGDGAWTPEF